MIKSKILSLALILGIINAIVFKLFEYIVTDGTNWLWNDLFNSDYHRIRVIPIAVFFGFIYSSSFNLLHRKRMDAPEVNALDATTNKKSLQDIGIIAIIGVASLLAGASLGPEATLMGISGGLGVWFASKANLDKASELLALISIGALLVAFLDSIFLIIFPLLILAKKKHLSFATALPVIFAGFTSYITLWLIDHGAAGYSTFALSGGASYKDVLLALVVGVFTSFIGWLLNYSRLNLFYKVSQFLDNSLGWAWSGMIFGGVIGLFYFICGSTIQFSGSQGSFVLLSHAPYGLANLILIFLGKLIVTGWSDATRYRGGLVFPSIFMGITLALMIENIFSITASGVVVGAIAGIFTSLTGPATAFIFLIAILPIKLLLIAAVAIFGAQVGKKTIRRWLPAPEVAK